VTAGAVEPQTTKGEGGVPPTVADIGRRCGDTAGLSALLRHDLGEFRRDANHLKREL